MTLPEIFQQVTFMLMPLLQLVQLFRVDVLQRSSTGTFPSLKVKKLPNIRGCIIHFHNTFSDREFLSWIYLFSFLFTSAFQTRCLSQLHCQFDCIFHLVTVNSDLRHWPSKLTKRVKMNHRAKRLGKASFHLEVIIWTHTHTHTDWLLYVDH